jgi:hypothetical protein
MPSDAIEAVACDLNSGSCSTVTVGSFHEMALIRGEPDPWCPPHKGLLAGEVPFRNDLVLQLMDLIEGGLGLRPARKGLREACGALIANVLYAFARAPETWVFYSRDWNHYAACARARRYTPRTTRWPT